MFAAAAEAFGCVCVLFCNPAPPAPGDDANIEPRFGVNHFVASLTGCLSTRVARWANTYSHKCMLFFSEMVSCVAPLYCV